MLMLLSLYYKNGFTFRGRTSRKAYWLTSLLMTGVLFFLVLLIALPLYSFISGSLLSLSAFRGGGPSMLWFLGAMVIGLFAIVSSIPMFAMQVRRLHDANLSGWWYVLLIFSTQLLGCFHGVSALIHYA